MGKIRSGLRTWLRNLPLRRAFSLYILFYLLVGTAVCFALLAALGNTMNGLYAAYQGLGLTEQETGQLLQLEIPAHGYFHRRGLYYYHGGGNILFEAAQLLPSILQQQHYQ